MKLYLGKSIKKVLISFHSTICMVFCCSITLPLQFSAKKTQAAAFWLHSTHHYLFLSSKSKRAALQRDISILGSDDAWNCCSVHTQKTET